MLTPTLSALILALPLVSARPLWLRDVPTSNPSTSSNLTKSTPSGSYFAFATAANSFTSNLSSIVVFGDSLSDNGDGVYKLSGGLLPSLQGYPNGTFSNGPVYPTMMSERLGLPLTDFAIGGATTFNTGANLIIPNIFTNTSTVLYSTIDQIDRYLNTSASTGAAEEMASTLHIIFSGGNDLLGGYNISGTQTAQAVQGGVDSLIAAGSRHILVINLLAISPSLLLPEFEGNANSTAEYFANAYTNDLHTSIDSIFTASNYSDVVAISDLWSASQVIAAAPSMFGFDAEKLDQACLSSDTTANGTTYTICDNVNDYFFWDDVHPTTRGQSILAGLNLATLLEKGWAVNA